MTADIVRQLTAALEGLLRAEDCDGNRLFYAEHREPVRNTVAIGICRVCGELEGHRDVCAVGTAEELLRRLTDA